MTRFVRASLLLAVCATMLATMLSAGGKAHAMAPTPPAMGSTTGVGSLAAGVPEGTTGGLAATIFATATAAANASTSGISAVEEVTPALVTSGIPAALIREELIERAINAVDIAITTRLLANALIARGLFEGRFVALRASYAEARAFRAIQLVNSFSALFQ